MERGFPPVPGFVYIIPCDLSLYLYRLVKVVQTETWVYLCFEIPWLRTIQKKVGYL